ncbi:MAG: HTH-type transcriptional regulatory protein GabR [Planctomycetes bacterium]|nr:HTH-type transcriptional regulatory protein GabR [Planctomycetota bacterium]
MPDLLVDLETPQNEAPLYQRIADSIRADVLAGRLRRGERVPSTRTLAKELDVNRNTVAQAYEQLVAEGFLEGKHGSGTYVARELPQANFNVKSGLRTQQKLRRVALANSPVPPAFYHRVLQAENPAPVPGVDIDMRLGAPDISAFPLRQWRRIVGNQLLVARRDRMNYGSAYGLQELREQIAAYLGRARGIDCGYRNVLVTSGSQQGLWLAASLLVGEGDAVMVEDPGYLGARSIFSALGARQLPIPVDDAGADAAVVARNLAEGLQPKLLHLTPSHQYPTGVTLSAARRMEMLELAAEHGFMIVEDDYDSEFRYEGRPVRALAGIDGADSVIYVGSFSKVMYPSLRVGYVVAPEWLIEAMVGLRWHIDFMPPMLESAALAQFIEEGHFERHLRRMRTLYAEKRAAFNDILQQNLPAALPQPVPAGGMKMMLNVPSHLTRQDAYQKAMEAGVRVYDQSACYFEQEQAPNRLTIGFTALPIEKVKEAAHRLVRAWT